MPNRKSSNLAATSHYRSMSTESYHQQPNLMPTTSGQNWNHAPAQSNSFIQHYPNEQTWQPGMAMQQRHPHQQNQHQHPMIAAGGPMDIDGGFFTSDVKRNLFW